jgi:hypothetical protein
MRLASVTRAAIVASALGAFSGPARAASLVILDDGERVARDASRPLPQSPWPRTVSLFAMRGETVAVQAVIESREPLRGIHAALGAMEPAARDGAPGAVTGAARGRIELRVETWGEHFVDVARPSGNEREPGSLAFTAEGAPDPASVTGFVADALIPGDAELAEGDRAALWIDLTVPPDAPPGDYTGVLHVSSAAGVIGARDVSLHVLDRDMPWAAQKTMIYYEPKNLERRMGDGAAELELRRVFHAHRVSAIHDVRDARELDVPGALDGMALSGELFTPARGYDGPGQGEGEGVFVLGAYGSLEAPNAEHLAAAERLATRARALAGGRVQDTQMLLYAIDETCDSPWPAAWRVLAAGSEAMRGVRIGATCGVDPVRQGADLVIMTAPDYVPERARVAKAAGKWVWAYNGQRPYAGPMMLDVPAVDLRANVWIAARYGIERWFYWESTYWYDDNRGGRGGWDGFDPFDVAETFHNADGDWADGDGILVYPGTQIGARGMRDFGAATVFPSVRLKNVRRGVEDAAYIEAARGVDREAADAVVRRVVPRALSQAGRRPSWPERGAAFLDARAELARILDRAPEVSAPAEGRGRASRAPFGLLAALGALIAAVRLLSTRRAQRDVQRERGKGERE